MQSTTIFERSLDTFNRCQAIDHFASEMIQVLMHKLDGNRTLAHGEVNAPDRTVTHVAGYLLAGLAQPHRADEFPLVALKECYHAFRYLQSILVAGRSRGLVQNLLESSLLCRIAEDAAPWPHACQTNSESSRISENFSRTT